MNQKNWSSPYHRDLVFPKVAISELRWQCRTAPNNHAQALMHLDALMRH